MTTRRKILLGVLGFYFISIVLVLVIFGFTRQDNDEFQPQNEFQLDTWVELPGPFDINKAVMYLVISGILTCGHDDLDRQPHAGATEPRCRPRSRRCSR